MLASAFLLSTDKRIRAYLIAALAAAMVAAGSVAYDVKAGDTLTAIASEHGVSVTAILELNDISDPDLIRVGQEIVIPGEGGGSSQVHVVAAGETLGDIAQHYAASADAIVRANDLADPNLIRVGERLSIPGGPEGSGGTDHHVVQAGETLSSIAAKHGISASDLAEANGITNPELLYVGTRLALSGQSYVAEAAGESEASTHTVAGGETLAGIADMHGVTIEEIARANGIVDPNRIRIGETLTIPGGGWVCPVSGASYVNDWGFPRSGDRFHQGTDLFAPRGAEVVAPVGGQIKLITGEVGGLQFFLYGDDGVTYVGTHLDAFGRSGRVEAGQVIGYVGDTGNARGGPTHLHFEMHPGDGDPINPYPTLQQSGC